MDVRCERCDTEYELDDDAIPPGGCPVQCTTCGHTFTVAKAGMRPPISAPAELSPAPTMAEWLLETGDGKLHRFRNLTSLQKWIIERKVTREDKISRTGHAWRRLGEIVELGPFFDVVDEADRAKAAAAASDDPLKTEAARARHSRARPSARLAPPPPEPTPDPSDTLEGRPGLEDDSEDDEEYSEEDDEIETPPPRRPTRAAARPRTSRRDFDDELSPNPSMVTSVVRLRSGGGSPILKFGAIVLIASAVAVGAIFLIRKTPQQPPVGIVPPAETATPLAIPAPGEPQHAPPLPSAPTPPLPSAPTPLPSSTAIPGETVTVPTPSPSRIEKKPTPVADDPSASYEKLLEQADRLLENGITERAFKLYDRAIKIQPQGVEALVGLGYVMLDKGRNAPAIGYFKKALAGAPSFGPAWFGLAEAARNAGDTPEAIRSYKRYLEINPSSQYSSAARRQLQILQDAAAHAAPGPTDPP